MAKVDKSNENNKYSKISSALKCQLFKLIYLQKTSIKNVINFFTFLVSETLQFKLFDSKGSVKKYDGKIIKFYF